MSFAKDLKNKALKVWEDGYCHPFVQELGTGKLPVMKFKFYLLQDYQYLLSYAKVFALAAVKADTYALTSRFTKLACSTLNEEMDIHRKYMVDFGISAEEIAICKPSLFNQAYTSNMLAIATTGSLAELIAAIFPCAWTYSDYAKRLKTDYKPYLKRNYYKSWIEAYAADEFAESFEWLYPTLDNLCMNFCEEQLERLEEIFVSSVKFEYLFWDMSYKCKVSY